MYEAINAAFPRLILALQRSNGMGRVEAVGVIYAARYGGECGAACAAIRRAVNARHLLRTLRLAA